jgi:catechol 2,3-dioxygenase-like lactoylglutathione lyase family enzyme
MRLIRPIPAFPVRDTAKSALFYRDKLGFTIVHQEARFAICERDGLRIHLWGATDEGWRKRIGFAETPVLSGAESFIAGTASCRIEVDGVEELHRALEPQGVLHPNAPLRDQPWGNREFGVLDLDSNLITFYQRNGLTGRAAARGREV